MNKLQQIIAFFCLYYPLKSELSKARLTKLVYLADWLSSLTDGEQLTEIEWVFNHYGPYVDDVVDAANRSFEFSVTNNRTIYGTLKHVVSFHGDESEIDLSEREKTILQTVIGKTKSMNFKDFIDYVYSTYPVKANERYSSLNLVALANQYKSLHP